MKTLDIIEKSKKCRDIYPEHFVKAFPRNSITMSWGLHNFVGDKRYVRFTVNGFQHKGYVYIFCNAADLLDIYLTDTDNNIKKEINDIYLDMMLDTLDHAIEVGDMSKDQYDKECAKFLSEEIGRENV